MRARESGDLHPQLKRTVSVCPQKSVTHGERERAGNRDQCYNGEETRTASQREWTRQVHRVVGLKAHACSSCMPHAHASRATSKPSVMFVLCRSLKERAFISAAQRRGVIVG